MPPLHERRLPEVADGPQSGGGSAYLRVPQRRVVRQEVMDWDYIVHISHWRRRRRRHRRVGHTASPARSQRTPPHVVDDSVVVPHHHLLLLLRILLVVVFFYGVVLSCFLISIFCLLLCFAYWLLVLLLQL